MSDAMSSAAEHLEVEDPDQVPSPIQDEDLEDFLGTRIDESHQEHEDMELVYDPNLPLAEATSTTEYTTLRLTNVEELRLIETSQGPGPTQRSRPVTPRLENAVSSPDACNPSRSNNLVPVEEDDSPPIKKENQDDDIICITDTLAEPIVISDDEDTVPTDRSPALNASARSSTDKLQKVNGTRAINIGNSILRTRRKKQGKPTKEHMEVMKKAQQMLAQQSMSRSRASGAAAIFKGVTSQIGVSNPNVSVDVDGVATRDVGTGVNNKINTVTPDVDDHAWMNEELEDDSDDSIR